MIDKIKSLRLNDYLNIVMVIFVFVFPLSAKKTYPILIVLILLWIVEGKWREKIDKLLEIKAFIFYTLFILFWGLSLLWSDTIYGGFTKHYPSNGILEYFKMYFLCFLVVPIFITSIKEKYIQYIISAFLSAMFISELASWGIFLDILHLHGKTSDDPSPFMHHSLYSIFLAVTFFVLVTEYFKTTNLKLKIFIMFFAASALVNLFLNGGRLGQIAFMLGAFVYIFSKYKITIKTFFIAIISIGVIVGSAYFVSPIFQQRVHTTVHSVEKLYNGEYNTSWGIRVYALKVAQGIVYEHPLFGVGIGNAKNSFMDESKQYKHGYLVKSLWHMHNQYMQILLETGIIGLVLFLIFIWQLLKLQLDRDYKVLLYAFIMVYMFGFIGEPLFWNRQPFILFNFFIAFFLYHSIHRVSHNQ
jgi:O-antigen ligase